MLKDMEVSPNKVYVCALQTHSIPRSDFWFEPALVSVQFSLKLALYSFQIDLAPL